MSVHPHQRVRPDEDEVVIDQEKVRTIIAETKKMELAKLMEVPEFRRFLHRLFAEAGVMRSVLTNNSQIYALAARQDLGHQLFMWAAEADETTAFDVLRTSKYGDQTYV
jgi:hypothetical protein